MQKKGGQKIYGFFLTGRVKREGGRGVCGSRADRGVERVLKKRGNRTHKKHRLQNAKSAAALRSRARVSAGARACTRGIRARCAFLFSSFFLLPSFLRFPRPLRRTRAYTCTRPPPSFYARSCLLYLRVRCTTDAEKARIKLSRWFVVCIAWRRRVMRAGVRIYG